MVSLLRAKQVRDYMVKQGHSVLLFEVIENLKGMGYTDDEIRLGFMLYLLWLT